MPAHEAPSSATGATFHDRRHTATSLVSPKFQVVVPKEIRKTLGLKPGQRLQFIEKDGRIEIRPILTPDQLIGFLKDKAHIPFHREKLDRPYVGGETRAQTDAAAGISATAFSKPPD